MIIHIQDKHNVVMDPLILGLSLVQPVACYASHKRALLSAF